MKLSPTEVEKHIDDNPAFCALMFTHTHVATSGNVYPCCVADYSDPVGKVQEGDINEMWTSEKYQEWRQQMIDGKKVKVCNRCYMSDELGASDRQMYNRQYLENQKRSGEQLSFDTVTGNDRNAPLWIDLRPGNKCNLMCRMCSSEYSHKIYKEYHADDNDLRELVGINQDFYIAKDWLNDDETFEQLYSYVRDMDILKLAGGETMVMNGFVKLLHRLIEDGRNEHVRLDITTNGTMTQGKVMKLVEQFRHMTINLSVDGMDETNKYIRYGSDSDNLAEAFATYNEMTNSINALMTVQAYNIFDLVPTYKHWLDMGGRPHTFIFNLVYYPRHLQCNVLPRELRMEARDDLLALRKEMSQTAIDGTRINAVIEWLENDGDADANVATQFAAVTREYDRIRNQSYTTLDPRIVKYINTLGG